MTKRRKSTDGRGARTEADYAAAAEWAETSIPDTLDARLEQHLAITHSSRSEVRRIALEQYLERSSLLR